MKRIIYTSLGGLLFLLFYFFNSQYIVNSFQPKKFIVYIEVETIEQDIYQLYYREANGKLDESLSEKVKIEGSKNPQLLKFTIPDTLNISHFRFDFGNKERESDIRINTITFSYNGNKEVISTNQIHEFFKLNHYTELVGNKFKRKVIEGRSDPFILSINLEKVINCLKEKPNYARVILNVLLSFVLTLSILIAFSLYTKNKYVKGLNDSFFVAIFITILLLPHLDEHFYLDSTAISEKRQLLEKPIMTIDNYQTYPREFESYYDDNFGFRKKLVSFGAIFKIKLFNSTPNSKMLS